MERCLFVTNTAITISFPEPLGVFVVSQRQRVDVPLLPGLLRPAAQGYVAFYELACAAKRTGTLLVHAELWLHA